MKTFSILLLAFLPLLAASSSQFSPFSNGLQLTVTGPGTVFADWSITFPSGFYTYTVTVYDRTAQQTLTSFQTTALSATLNNLPSGHTIRVTVSDGMGEIVTSDISGI